MSALSLSSSKTRPVAIVDIQSGCVSIAIALLHQDKPLEILAAGRSDLSFEDRTPEAVLAALPDQINEAGKKALDTYTSLQKSHGSITNVFCIMNTPWVRSQTIRTVAKFDTEVAITEHMIADLAKQALDESTEINAANLLEANVVRIELNGYATSEPIGKQAHKVSVYALISGCEPQIRSIVQDALHRLFPAPVVFRSQFRTILSVVEAIPGLQKDFCLVDLTRDTTIIANIHTGLSMAHKTVDEGLLSIIKRIAGKRMPEETLSLMRMVTDETCSTDACTEITEATTRVEPDLVRVFADAMVELASTRYLPPLLVLLCEDALAPWLTTIFSRIDFTQFTTTTHPFEVIVLSSESLRRFVVPSRLTINQRLLLSAAFVSIEQR
ncbi:hypothetical protein HZC00_04260 [Candidatus Kaiserbacteria bacterium]|nr:hypothetical protein [Candidatus Kaiserbacteria bacterium]